ncbi:MAG: hypothetical protein A2Y10_09155 [Planctomycetes bacterium GWF2_41_51]|nr:MAG: hypothetical protein A2Y10_09155 [Planctomycetes bacterium GWF2_41_51]
MKRSFKILFTGILIFANLPVFAAKTYYVAPQKQGNGDALTPANAAFYLSFTGFWNGKVKPALNNEPVTVWFVEGLGDYSTDRLNLSGIGNAANLFTLKGQKNGDGVWFNLANDENEPLLNLYDAINVIVQDLNFTGDTCLEMAISLDYANNIEIDSCCFDEMRNAEYCAIWICHGANNIKITNNWFSRIGKDYRAHGLYCRANCNNIEVTGNTFKDISGAYVVIRNNINNLTISNNQFESTGTYYWIENGRTRGEDTYVAITIHNMNDSLLDAEVFGDNYTITDNNFVYAQNSMLINAIGWSHKGYETGGYSQIPDQDEAEILENGGPNAKNDFLRYQAGFIPANMTITGNYYSDQIDERIIYEWREILGLDPNNLPIYDDWQRKDIYSVFYQTRFSYDWESESDLNYWTVSEVPPYSDIYTTPNIPIQGARSVRLKDLSSAHVANLYKNVRTPITYGYYRTWVRVNSHTTHVYPVYTTAPSTIYWIRGNGNHTWGNTVATFSGSWTTGTWYFLEMVFDFNTDKYTVWIDYDKVADNISIPTSNTSMSGNLVVAPAGTSAQGDIQIDYNLLGFYE